MEAKVIGDVNQLRFLFENLIDEALAVREEGVIRLQARKDNEYIRFLFITGISKFSQMSIFSELNNLQNISMWDEYSAICGITEQEVHTLQIDIEQMAQAITKHMKKLVLI